MTFTARLLPQTPTFGTPTWPERNLVQTGSVVARFLLVGEIIERKSLMFRTLTLPVWSHAEFGRVVIVVENELGGMQTLSINGAVEVPIFEVEE